MRVNSHFFSRMRNHQVKNKNVKKRNADRLHELHDILFSLFVLFEIKINLKIITRFQL